MAEMILKKKLKDLGLEKEFYITSRGTSREEEGNDIYPRAKKKLQEKNIPIENHIAKQLEFADYDKFDYFIAMDEGNQRRIQKLFCPKTASKVYKLLEFTKTDKDIADPWYTGDFEQAYQEIDIGTTKLLEFLLSKEK